MTELTGIVESLDGKVGGLEQKLEEVKATNGEGALGQTLGDVSGNDLKAAAMLLAFSQLRDSLNRQAPFEEDLALLQKMVGDDNPQLQEALLKLAPRANGGVLTPDGLSNEFKSLAGDIVVSSIKGEDVSIVDKAKARLGQVLQVEKNGEVITGTGTQATVARAQTLLDQGNVQAAIAELKTLDGEAAQTAQPFVQEAEMTLLAQQVQGMMQNMILGNIGALKVPAAAGATGAAIAPQGQSIDLNGVKETLEHAVPGQQEVIKDDESGLVILPRPQGFKGFSTGQP
jgi:mitofilin